MAVIPVELAGREYEVRVGTGLLADVAGQARPFLRKHQVCIVADENAR
ncbi:MAG: 3-dehydroquinate synthase, partial [Qipengyuania sp.]